MNRVDVPGTTDGWRNTWGTNASLVFAATSGVLLALAGLITVANGSDETDSYGYAMQTGDPEVRQIGWLLVALGVFAIVCSLIFLAWRHESRHQLRALIESQRIDDPAPEATEPAEIQPDPPASAGASLAG